MPWNETTKTQYTRPRDRFESDLTDEGWNLVEPCLPPPAKRGRPRKTDLREVFDAIQHVLATGCQWRRSRTLGSPLRFGMLSIRYVMGHFDRTESGIPGINRYRTTSWEVDRRILAREVQLKWKWARKFEPVVTDEYFVKGDHTLMRWRN